MRGFNRNSALQADSRTHTPIGLQSRITTI